MDWLGERLACGDEAAFAELYDAVADQLYRWLTIRLGTPDDAADVLQEVFVRLARQRHRLRKIQNVTGYVFVIARNESARLHAKRAREAPRQALPADLKAPPDTESSGPTAEALVDMLTQLTAEQREVVELKIYAGLTFNQIAAVTGAPVGTAASRYRAAIARLRSLVDQESM